MKSHFTSVANGLLANDQRPRIRLNELRVARLPTRQIEFMAKVII